MPLGLQNSASLVRKHVTFRIFRHAASSLHLRVAQSSVRVLAFALVPSRSFKKLRQFVCWVLLMFSNRFPLTSRLVCCAYPQKARNQAEVVGSEFIFFEATKQAIAFQRPSFGGSVAGSLVAQGTQPFATAWVTHR